MINHDGTTVPDEDEERMTKAQLSRREFLRACAVIVPLSGCSEDTLSPVIKSELPVDAVPEVEAQPGSWKIDFSTMPDGILERTSWVYDTTNGTDERGETIPVPGYNGEVDAYTDRPENVRIEGGFLVIEAHKEQLNGAEYSSGRITTKGIHDFIHGELTVRTKLPSGGGTFPAIWMLPTDPQYGEKYNGQPDFDWGARYEKNGEIDIVEAVGSEEGRAYGTFHTEMTHKTGNADTQVSEIGSNLYDFHDYTVRKMDGKIELLIDRKVYHSAERITDDSAEWPYEQKFHLIINLALGGKWAGSVDDTKLPARIEVSSITFTAL